MIKLLTVGNLVFSAIVFTYIANLSVDGVPFPIEPSNADNSTPPNEEDAEMFRNFTCDEESPAKKRNLGRSLGDDSLYFWMSPLHVYLPEMKTGKEYNEKQLGNIRDGIAEIGQVVPCLDIQLFEESKGHPRPEQHHVTIESTPGKCSSPVGYSSWDRSLKYSADFCTNKKATVIHEFFHLLGFYHEQRRADRDKYIKIYWKNVKDKDVTELKIVKGYYGHGPYDPQSIVHLPSLMFAKNMDKPIFEWIADKKMKVGSIGVLTEQNKKQAFELYCGKKGKAKGCNGYYCKYES